MSPTGTLVSTLKYPSTSGRSNWANSGCHCVILGLEDLAFSIYVCKLIDIQHHMAQIDDCSAESRLDCWQPPHGPKNDFTARQPLAQMRGFVHQEILGQLHFPG